MYYEQCKDNFNERVLVYTDVSFPIFALYPFHISDSLFSSQNGYKSFSPHFIFVEMFE